MSWGKGVNEHFLLDYLTFWCISLFPCKIKRLKSENIILYEERNIIEMFCERIFLIIWLPFFSVFPLDFHHSKKSWSKFCTTFFLNNNEFGFCTSVYLDSARQYIWIPHNSIIQVYLCNNTLNIIYCERNEVTLTYFNAFPMQILCECHRQFRYHHIQ